MRSLTILLAVVLSSFALPAQQLRRAVMASDTVVVGRVVTTRPLGQNIILYRIAVERSLKGDAEELLSVPIDKRFSDQGEIRPVLRSIYCVSRSQRDDLPESLAPYYRLTGYSGAAPVLHTSQDERALVGLLEAIIHAQSTDAAKHADVLSNQLFRLATGTHRIARLEALQVLREQVIVGRALATPQLDALLARAVDEKKDMAFKEALASLCVERRMPQAIEALCPSLKDSHPIFAKTLGRLAFHAHGAQVHRLFERQLKLAKSPEERGKLLIALGATHTPDALSTLLKWREDESMDDWVAQGLKVHGSQGAIDALNTDK